MSGDDGRPPADDSVPGDDAAAPPDDPQTGESDGDGRRSADERRERDDRRHDDARDTDGADNADGAGTDPDGRNHDSAPNGGRVGDAGASDGDGEAADRGPTPTRTRRQEEGSILDRFLHAERGPFLFLREILSSVGAVVAVGLVLFAVSGVWPPMVAVESGSMEPHMTRGDLVFITDEGRFMSDDATFEGTGVVTANHGREVGYRTFGGYGSVIVYDNPGRFGPPIIHRARFWVEKGENWYDEADSEYLNADNCEELANCPAPHAGFITKGDANPSYDQAMGISEPVKPGWINGVARIRIPYLGWIRLLFSEGFAAVLDAPAPGATVHVPPEAAWSSGSRSVSGPPPSPNAAVTRPSTGSPSATLPAAAETSGAQAGATRTSAVEQGKSVV